VKLSSWSYGHLFLAASLVAYGVALKKLFAETVSYSGEVVTDEYRLLLTASVGIFLLALALINYGLDDKLTPHSQMKRVLIYLAVAVLITAVGLLVTGLTATQFTGIILVIMLAVVAFNIYQAEALPQVSVEH
jgi:low temperature requirement protein LtrA